MRKKVISTEDERTHKPHRTSPKRIEVIPLSKLLNKKWRFYINLNSEIKFKLCEQQVKKYIPQS